jgi:hypothetical protein
MLLAPATVCLVLGLVLCSCASGDQTLPSPLAPSTPAATPPTTWEIEGPWASEAEEYFRAYGDAMLGPEALAAFFVEDAVYEVTWIGLDLHGYDEILQWFTWQGGESFSWGPMQIFLSEDRAVVIVREVDLGPGWDFLTEMAVFDMADGLIESHVAEWSATWLPAAGNLRRDDADQIEALYEGYVTAWNSGDPERIESFYRAGTGRTDGLFGGSIVLGEEWTVDIAPYLRPAAAGVAYEPVGQSYEPRDEVITPAIFTPASFSDPTVVHSIFDLRTSSGCPLRLLAEWELDQFEIVGEEVFYELGSLRRCGSVFDTESLPDGWWTGVSPPNPFTEEITAIVPTEAGPGIPIVNGGPRQVELVEWGLSRFEQAGLPPPRLDQVKFPPDSLCASAHAAGLTQLDQASAHLHMCLLEGEICVGPTCDSFQTRARFGVLHELGHVWEFQNVDEATRQAFLAQRDLETWSDADSGWAEAGAEGIEHAAEILAWGLMDEAVALIRIPNAAEDELRAGFRLLTGAEPLLGR